MVSGRGNQPRTSLAPCQVWAHSQSRLKELRRAQQSDSTDTGKVKTRADSRRLRFNIREEGMGLGEGTKETGKEEKPQHSDECQQKKILVNNQDCLPLLSLWDRR